MVWWRFLCIVGYLLTGSILILGTAVGRRCGLRTARFPDLARWWYGRLCHALDLHVQVIGEPAPNALLVANHISWLDIPVLGAQGRIDFLSKAEVRNWPLIGWMAEIAGTFFIARGAHQTGILISQIGERLSQGRWVAIFPEGTTTDGSRLRHFHPRLFGAAQLTGVLVQPVALRYGSNAVPDPVAPFVGNDILLFHLLRLTHHPGLEVRIQFLPPLDGYRLTRRDISEYCHRAIGDALGLETSNANLPPTDRKPTQPLATPAASRDKAI